MKDFIRKKIRKIVYDEYNHIIIDSKEYLDFENRVLNELYSNNMLEEGFGMESIIKAIKKELNK